MTGRLRAKDEENENESDWKFAAMVIDRWMEKLNKILMCHVCLDLCQIILAIFFLPFRNPMSIKNQIILF